MSVPSAQQQTPNRPARPTRVTIVCANLRNLPLTAFEYLVLHLNTLQRDVQYEFLPVGRPDELLEALRPSTTISIEQFNRLVATFTQRIMETTRQVASGYGLADGVVGRLLIISLASLDRRWYEVWKPPYSALFLGEWDKTMAPPSLLESIVSLVIMEGIYALVPEQARQLSHLATRGCIGDFNATLRDTRCKILQGFLCEDCRSIIEAAIGEDRTAVWVSLLKKDWIGKLSEPNSPASVVGKLGYNLFVTKGLAPSRWERMIDALTEEGVKEFIKLVAAAVLAALLLWLGLKSRS